MNKLDADAIRKNYHLVQQMKVLYHKMQGLNIDELADSQHDLYNRMRSLESLYADYIQEFRKQKKRRGNTP